MNSLNVRMAAVLAMVFVPLWMAGGFAQPRLVTENPNSYVPGNRIDSAVTVLDREMNSVRLTDLIKPESKVVVLVLFGGGAVHTTSRSPLWCADSFDDLAVQRALVHFCKGSPVQFVAVAVPPAYSPDRFGYKDVFLNGDRSSVEYRQEVQRFIEATESQRKIGLLPYDQVYYDPQLALMRKGSSPWEGNLKWHLDMRKYGVPTIWLLDGKGTVLQAPFWGNEYASDPPHVNYGFADLKAAVEGYLH